MARLFGTDGVRGLANKELTADLAYRLGRAAAVVVRERIGKRPKFLLGKDTRRSCDMLTAALMAGFMSGGADCMNAGQIPTPGIARLLVEMNFDAGVMVSASHNPFQDNGIKFFSGKGFKLSDAEEDEIEDIIKNRFDTLENPIGADVGVVLTGDSPIGHYCQFLKSCYGEANAKGFRIALDCANGATSVVAPRVFEQTGADILVINSTPDGVNINKDCGSTHMEQLIAFVKENHCDVGFAFDGDGDRCLVVDENGNMIDGDQILSILGNAMKDAGQLKHNTIVVTVMSNLGFTIMGKERGINIRQTKVGDRYVLEDMLANGYNLGGEQSGHVIMLDYNTTGDGILMALIFLRTLAASGKKLSELNTYMSVYPQSLVNARVNADGKANYANNPAIAEAINALDAKYAGAGRVLIRPSGTESLVRVMIEGQNLEEIQNDAKNLAALLQQTFPIE